MLYYSQNKRGENTMNYTIKKLDIIKGWIYINSFKSYTEAVEELERLKRMWKNARLEIITED